MLHRDHFRLRQVVVRLAPRGISNPSRLSLFFQRVYEAVMRRQLTLGGDV